MAVRASSKLKEQSIASPASLRTVIVVSLLMLAGVFFLVDIALGSVSIPFSEVLTIVFKQESQQEAWLYIIQKIRLPKAITAVVVGCGLSVSGLQMQTLFRNPLAGPSALGITAGAGLGVALVMLSTGTITSMQTIKQLGITGSWLLVLSATLGSALVLLIVMLISARIRDNVVMLIVGVMIGNITLSIISVWQYFSEPEQIQEYLLWTFGSLGGVTNHHLWVLTGVVGVGLGIAFISSKALNALLLGESYARSMGLTISHSRILIISSTSLLAGSITAFCGPIGFVGIAVPHLTRSLLNTSDHRILIPCTCLVGTALMLLCDAIAQMPGSQTVLPINIVTALVGSPVVIWVIMNRSNLKSSFS
jgi:iron complex transport system permease protein